MQNASQCPATLKPMLSYTQASLLGLPCGKFGFTGHEEQMEFNCTKFS